MPGRKSTKGSRKNVTKSSRCDIVFPVGRMNRYLKEGRYASQVGVGAGIFMAAVMEYLTCEILELAGNAADEQKKKTITPRHIQLAIRNDEELNKIMAEAMIAKGGVIPNVQAALFGKHGKSGAAAVTSNTQEMWINKES